jgi:hypothetical protein
VLLDMISHRRFGRGRVVLDIATWNRTSKRWIGGDWRRVARSLSAASGLGVIEESLDIGARRLLFPSERGAPALIQLE